MGRVIITLIVILLVSWPAAILGYLWQALLVGWSAGRGMHEAGLDHTDEFVKKHSKKEQPDGS